MHGDHGRARDHGALSVLDDAADGAGRHALRVRAARGPQQDATNQKSKRSKQGSATHVFSMARRHARPPLLRNGLVRKTRRFYRAGCDDCAKKGRQGVLTASWIQSVVGSIPLHFGDLKARCRRPSPCASHSPSRSAPSRPSGAAAAWPDPSRGSPGDGGAGPCRRSLRRSRA